MMKGTPAVIVGAGTAERVGAAVEVGLPLVVVLLASLGAMAIRTVTEYGTPSPSMELSTTSMIPGGTSNGATPERKSGCEGSRLSQG